MRVKISKLADDLAFLQDFGMDLDIVHEGFKKDNGCIEVQGFEFEEWELEFLD